MNLTVNGLSDAILTARSLENLQNELRDAMIQQLVQQSPSQVPANNNDRGNQSADAGRVFPGS